MKGDLPARQNLLIISVHPASKVKAISQMNHVIPLKCPSCGANIQVPEGATRVTCGYCGGQHLLNLTPAPAQPAQPAAAIRPRVKADASITIKSTPESLRITRRWFTPATLLLAIFALF